MYIYYATYLILFSINYFIYLFKTLHFNDDYIDLNWKTTDKYTSIFCVIEFNQSRQLHSCQPPFT